MAKVLVGFYTPIVNGQLSSLKHQIQTSIALEWTLWCWLVRDPPSAASYFTKWKYFRKDFWDSRLLFRPGFRFVFLLLWLAALNTAVWVSCFGS